MAFFEAIFEAVFENAVLEAFAKSFKYLGAIILRLTGGWKKPTSHYLEPKTYGYLPHFLGFAFDFCTHQNHQLIQC